MGSGLFIIVLSAAISIASFAAEEISCEQRMSSLPSGGPMVGDELELLRDVSSIDQRLRGTWKSQDVATARHKSAACHNNPAETCASVIRLSKAMKPGEVARIPKGTKFKIQRFQSGEIYLSWGLKRYLRVVCADSRLTSDNMSESQKPHHCTNSDIEQLFINHTLARCQTEATRVEGEDSINTPATTK